MTVGHHGIGCANWVQKNGLKFRQIHNINSTRRSPFARFQRESLTYVNSSVPPGISVAGRRIFDAYLQLLACPRATSYKVLTSFRFLLHWIDTRISRTRGSSATDPSSAAANRSPSLGEARTFLVLLPIFLRLANIRRGRARIGQILCIEQCHAFSSSRFLPRRRRG